MKVRELKQLTGFVIRRKYSTGNKTFALNAHLNRTSLPEDATVYKTEEQALARLKGEDERDYLIVPVFKLYGYRYSMNKQRIEREIVLLTEANRLEDLIETASRIVDNEIADVRDQVEIHREDIDLSRKEIESLKREVRAARQNIKRDQSRLKKSQADLKKAQQGRKERIEHIKAQARKLMKKESA